MKQYRKQAGATLVVSLIMLVVLTLLVVSAIRSGTTNLRITGNMQVQTEATAAAQQAIEQVLDTDFYSTPAAQTITVDNGLSSYAVAVSAPACGHSTQLLPENLDKDDPDDQKCISGNEIYATLDADGNQLKEAALCNRETWELQATVSDAQSGSKTTVVQGVILRTGRDSGC